MPTIQTPHRSRVLEEIKVQVEAVHRLAEELLELSRSEKAFPKAIGALTTPHEEERVLDRMTSRVSTLLTNATCLAANLKEENAHREPHCIDHMLGNPGYRPERNTLRD
jgi:hypothetical protein